MAGPLPVCWPWPEEDSRHDDPPPLPIASLPPCTNEELEIMRACAIDAAIRMRIRELETITLLNLLIIILLILAGPPGWIILGLLILLSG